jgi:hypothetical protein
MTAELHSLPRRISPKAALTDYLERVYPARRHGATDCGEYLADGGALSDADHMLQWLAERGLTLVNVKGSGK